MLARLHRFVRPLAVGAAFIAMTACMAPHRRYYVVGAPPPERVEVITSAPAPNYAWVRGYWRWEGRDYSWIGGHWERPAARYHEWAPGHWEREYRGWYWVDGRWR